jgi:peptide/nickel transport system substrate-binding protein
MRSLMMAAAVAGALSMSLGLIGARTASAQDAETPKVGGTLTVAVEADLRNPDAMQMRLGIDKMIVGSTAYDPLFQTDERGNPLPALATEATPSADAKEWTFKLREGVKFQNGKTFTASDVKKNIEAHLDPKWASNMAGDLSNIESVTVVNDYEMKIVLKTADGRLPYLFTDHIMIADMDDYTPGHPIGTGPYAWDDRVVGDRIVFKRFDDHWRGKPPLDRVVFRVIADSQVAALELQAGNIDMIPTNVSTHFLPVLRANPDIKLYETDGNTWYGVYFNFEKGRNGGYKDDMTFRKFREGMAYLWNGQEMVQPIIGEFGVFATQVSPPWQLGADPEMGPWPYDVEKGTNLLAEAGYAKGAEIVMTVQNRPHTCDLATAFASRLTELGYKPSVKCYEPEVFFDAVRKYDWDLLVGRVSGRTNAYQNYRDRWRSSLAPVPPDDQWTYRSDEIDALIGKMGATADTVEFEQIGKRIANIISKEDIATLPAYFDKVRVAARSRVHGIKVSPIVYYGFLMNAMTTVWVGE